MTKLVLLTLIELTTSFIVISTLTVYWNEHKSLPTQSELEHVWAIGEAPEDEANDEEKAQYARKIDILTWYIDEWLPMVVGIEYWGPHLRPYHLMDDKMDMAAGLMRVLVTITSEAFGYLIYANCRGKWVAGLQWKDTNPKIPCPVYNKKRPETHCYRPVWSDSKSGQVKGGGWEKKAYTKYNKMITLVKEFRVSEEANGHEMMLFAQTLIKAVHEIPEGDTEPPKKKRRTGGDSDEEDPEPVELDFLDE